MAQRTNQVLTGYEGACLLVLIAIGTTVCNKLDSLRLFRDKILIDKFGIFGQFLVKVYYYSSPFLCRTILKKKLMRQISLFLIKPYIYLIDFLIKI